MKNESKWKMAKNNWVYKIKEDTKSKFTIKRRMTHNGRWPTYKYDLKWNMTYYGRWPNMTQLPKKRRYKMKNIPKWYMTQNWRRTSM